MSEEDCLEYFSVVRMVIELILDEREHARLMKLKKKTAMEKLGVIAGEVKDSVNQKKND